MAFEYMTSVVSSSRDDKDDIKCLSTILSSAPTNVAEIEREFDQLLKELQDLVGESMTNEELEEFFRVNNQC